MDKKGFTLMEMIISLALVGLVLVFLTPFLSNSFRALNTVSDKSKYQTVTTVALDYIKETLSQATAVTLSDVAFNDDDLNAFKKDAQAAGGIYCTEGDLYIINEGALVYGISKKSIDGNMVSVSFKGTGKKLAVTLRIMSGDGAQEIYNAETQIALTGLYDFEDDPGSNGDKNIDRDFDDVWYDYLYYCIQYVENGAE